MKRQIVLIASLLVGLLAAVLTRVYITAKEAEFRRDRDALVKRYGTMDVLCFKVDTPGGTAMTRKDIGVKTVPGLGMKGQALTVEDVDAIIGRRTTMAHKKGDVIFWNDIEGGDPSVKGLSADIKQKMRAISVNVGTSSSVSGMVRPNDHVDVIGTFDFPGDDGAKRRGDPVTCTILQNVLVLATGRETAKSRERNMGSSSGYSTVTLEVSPREAEMLAFAEQMKGRLTLTLRSRSDTSYVKELPQVDYKKIRDEIEELNLKRQTGH